MLFSIVIPVYNRGAFIGKAIESVLAQTYTNWELIIIDDASTDDTFKVIQSYADSRISVFRNDINLERSATRNKGINLAKGEYICFLDSDDYYLKNHLEVFANAISVATQPVALFYSDVQQHHLITNTVKDIERKQGRNPVESVVACHIPVISVAIHRTIFEKFRFHAKLHINEDVYLFALISSVYPLVYIPKKTVIWILHGNNTANQETDYLLPQLEVTRKMFSDPFLSKEFSAQFKKEKYFDLYAQLLYNRALNKKMLSAIGYFFKALYVGPLKKANLTNFLNVLYHLPGGHLFKAIREKMRRHKLRK